MVYKCCVPLCRGNYDKETKVCVFQFPTDEALKEKWLNAIPRKDFQPSQYSKVCQLHFDPEEILWETTYFDERSGKSVTAPLHRPKLRTLAVPHIFPKCPSYLSSTPSTSREDPAEKRQRRESAAVEAAIQASIRAQEVYETEQELTSFEKTVILSRKNKHTDYWDLIIKADYILFLHINNDKGPVLTHAMTIDPELSVKVYKDNVEITTAGKFKLPFKASFMYEIYELLDIMEASCQVNISNNLSEISKAIDQIKMHDCENENFYNFFSTQIQLLQKNKQSARYNSDMLVFASMFFLISPQAYKFVRNSGNFILPHPNTIKRICSSFKLGPDSEQREEGFLFYLKQRTRHLETHERHVTLMVDEVHIKKYMDYKGGSIVGSSFDSENLASSAHVFMVQSLLSTNKDVVHILPVSSMTASTLHTIIKKVILGIEKAGLKVIAVITDNNSINRKAMSYFSQKPAMSIVYPHPSDASRPLFFVIDPVHIFKCIRNNWVNQKNDGVCMHFPDFNNYDIKYSASFQTLRQLYNLEAGKLLKYGYGLTVKSLWPSNIEKQNVRLVCQIFNDYIIEALRTLGHSKQLKNVDGTAFFISIVSRWWKVVNVKSPNKGRRHNDEYLNPVTNSINDHNLKFLDNFLSWLNSWHDMSENSGFLTKETFTAIKHTTHALLELTSFCFEEMKMKYVLLGKFQTDVLEARFGLYRQLAGAQYNLSVRQVFEVEHKLRMSKSIQSLRNSLSSATLTSDDCFESGSIAMSSELLPFHEIIVTADDQAVLTEDMPVIVYVAGYCAFSQCKKINCDLCRDNLITDRQLNVDSNSFTNNLDRGGLHYPQQQVVDIVIYNYVVVKKLLNPENLNNFLQLNKQRSIAIHLTKMALENDEFSYWNNCPCGQETEKIVENILLCSTNCLLNNFTKNTNNSCGNSNFKRKLSTLVT